jgi:hypothetical protein
MGCRKKPLPLWQSKRSVLPVIMYAMNPDGPEQSPNHLVADFIMFHEMLNAAS